MKILIADDERMVRLGLKLMLEELYPERFVYLEATNGMELTVLARDTQPDIIFLDIKMPLMDGLTAFASVKDYCTQTQFVILSGYSNFEYAQKALKLGAKDYLLKPVSLETDAASDTVIGIVAIKKIVFLYTGVIRSAIYTIKIKNIKLKNLANIIALYGV